MVLCRSAAMRARARRDAAGPTSPCNSASPSEQTAAVRDLEVRADQHHRPVFIRQSESQNLALEGSDLSRREIHDRTDLSSDELVRLVVDADLRGGTLRPDFRPEIDLEF